jgi:hypothetical protein
MGTKGNFGKEVGNKFNGSKRSSETYSCIMCRDMF